MFSIKCKEIELMTVQLQLWYTLQESRPSRSRMPSSPFTGTFQLQYVKLAATKNIPYLSEQLNL